MEFKEFADLVNAKFNKMTEQDMFKANSSKEQLWSTYQNSFKPKDNPIFRERRVHECDTCYSFIKRLGAAVVIVDGKLDTIWNIPELQEPYKSVAAEMHKLVSTSNISSIFLSDEELAGKEFSTEFNNPEVTWEHFYADIPAKFISRSVATDRGEIDSTVSVYKRALEEFSVSTLETVLDLCDTIYRGEEFAPTVRKFLEAKVAYEESNKAYFIWQTYKQYPAKIRNTAIGSLIIDIQKDIELNEAVSRYEAVVAPTNYKRTSAVATPGMKKAALEAIDNLGYRDSLPRRHATLDDISVNDVLFASRASQNVMKDELDSLLGDNSSKVEKAPRGSQTVSIEEFLANVLPNSEKVEALVENKHTGNFVSLVAPVNADAKNMLKWDNNFSWSYNGEVTDSILKQKVVAAGGRTGAFRFSHSWNSIEPNQSLMDLHVFMPGCTVPTSGGGPDLPYGSRRVGWNNRTDSKSGGRQDVDYINAAPKGYVPVENITFPDIGKMPEGTYTCAVHNWNFRGTAGKGQAEIEFNGQVFEYIYPATTNHKWITIAEVTLKDGEFTIEHKLKPENLSKEEWSINTLSYQPVSTIMLSPNFWNDQSIGNKHYFFMLEGCKNPADVRGFYNEFLSEELRPYRKSFEMLSANMKCTPIDEQLSGLGFSSTVANTLSVKVDGRPYTINFKDK